jgi:hypothetical protein
MWIGNDEQCNQHGYKYDENAFGRSFHLGSEHCADKCQRKRKYYAGRQPTVHFVPCCNACEIAPLIDTANWRKQRRRENRLGVLCASA